MTKQETIHDLSYELTVFLDTLFHNLLDSL